jgi:hypothetical protein
MRETPKQKSQKWKSIGHNCLQLPLDEWVIHNAKEIVNFMYLIHQTSTAG